MAADPRGAHDDPRGAHTERELSSDEIAAEAAVDLPDREAMSTIGHGFGHGFDNFAMPINEANAANIYSTSSIAAADADQTIILTQTSDD